MKVIIVGGGIFGASTAIELKNRFHHVVLIDRGQIPHVEAASTDINKMIRMDYGPDKFYMNLADLALQKWRELNAEWKEELYHECGILALKRTPFTPNSFEYDSLALTKAKGVPIERLTMDQLSKKFPAIDHKQFADAYWNPVGGWAESTRVVARFIEKCRKIGVEIMEFCPFKEFIFSLNDKKEIIGVRTENGLDLYADLVIMCTGPWTPTYLPHLRNKMCASAQTVIHLQPKESTTNRLDDYKMPKLCPFFADVSELGWYGFPLHTNGSIKVANHGPGRKMLLSTHMKKEDLQATKSEIEHILTFAKRVFPKLRDNFELIGTRVCFYCDTFDGDFWINRDKYYKNLVVAAGGSGHAFKFGPVLGEIIADVAEDKPNPWAVRFAWRENTVIKREKARSNIVLDEKTITQPLIKAKL